MGAMRDFRIARHAAILRHVRSGGIRRQKDLVSLLRDEGFVVGQATLSRDIRALRLVKAASSDGTTKYVAPDPAEQSPSLKLFLPKLCLRAEAVGNLGVLHTVHGAASAIAAAMESDHVKGLAGTIAGDNTLLMIFRRPRRAAAYIREIDRLRAAPGLGGGQASGPSEPQARSSSESASE